MKNNKKQTAVEWYNEQLNVYGDMAFNKEITLGQYHIKKQELLEQAKEMGKEQIEEAFADGVDDEYEYHINNQPRTNTEQYYNETYGGMTNENQ